MRTSILIILIFLSTQIKAQPSHGKDAYINFIQKFYYHLLKDDAVTVREFTELFGINAIEDESYLFNLICDENPNNDVCKERGVNSIANEWGDYESIFFREIKKLQNRFTQGYVKDIDSIIQHCSKIYDEGSVSSIALDIYFPNGKEIAFIMNRYPDEPISIENIYLADGIYFYYNFGIEKDKDKFNPEIIYLQRLAIINDPDGYTNVREGKGAEYPIVGKIVTNEVFMFTPNYYEDWWKVSNKDETVVGYMHKSRIVPFGNLSEEKKKELKSKY